MDNLFLVGRVILAMYYVMMGAMHFMQLESMAGYAASKKMPAPKLAVMGSGLLLLIGGLSIGTGFQPLVGVICIVAFMLPVSLMMHNFWTIEDDQMKMAEMTNFMKNMGLMASALMFLAIPTPWVLSLAF